MILKPPAGWVFRSLLKGAGVVIAGLLAVPASAATAAGCEGGGFTVLGHTGPFDADIPAASVPGVITVQGKYNRFDIDARTFGIRDYAFLPTTNPLDMTNGAITPVWASKTPDHRGLVLNGAVSLSLDGEVLVISRLGPGLSMTISAKDCAQGGVFQMEPERADGTTTRIVHTLVTSVAANQNLTPFFFDNPNFRAREGDVVPFKDTTITVTARINIANDFSPRFVARDSAQVATRVNEPACATVIRTRFAPPKDTVVVQHCGHRSIWDVASGGRMGFVTGEDSVEVAPPPTNCTHQCQAQNRVRGRAVVLGFPFPVPQASRLNDPTP